MKSKHNYISVRGCVLTVLASLVLAFGLYNVHAQADVTEGGVLGMTLFLHALFDISPAVTTLLLNLLC